MSGRLDGRVALITGGARGIGRGIAEAYAAEGCAVVLGDVLTDQATATADAIRGRGGSAFAVHLDVRSAESADASVEMARALTGAIDILVNNAAIYDGLRVAPLETLTNDEWDDVLAVNVRGVWNVTRATLGPMRERGYGKIVNLASGTAIAGTPFHLHYVASKGAVIAMTRALGNELGPRGIRVNCVAPGFTPTPGSGVLGAYDPSRTPLGRVMRPDDLLGTFCYLLSDDAAFVSGQTLLVNGGRVPH